VKPRQNSRYVYGWLSRPYADTPHRFLESPPQTSLFGASEQVPPKLPGSTITQAFLVHLCPRSFLGRIGQTPPKLSSPIQYNERSSQIVECCCGEPLRMRQFTATVNFRRDLDLTNHENPAPRAAYCTPPRAVHSLRWRRKRMR
jgi:hypothetical protein